MSNPWREATDHANCEFGAPVIDCKRPYGNGDVFTDMAALLPHLADDEMAMARLHGELILVLEAVLSSRSFEPGVYERVSRYGSKWHLASPLPGGEEK